MYHTNLFAITKSEPLPIFRYNAMINPKPDKKPQLYQILNQIAKSIIYNEQKAVISINGKLESLGEPIEKLSEHTAKIVEDKEYSVTLEFQEKTDVSIDSFEEYKLLVNRLIDLALTQLSGMFYKFHPDAPFIIKDEPYFDNELIKNTGIIDSKKYYRSIILHDSKPYVLIDRETELQSNQNLLTELKALKTKFEGISKSEIDFYDPPDDFVDYVNSLIVSKAARVLKYPGPSIKKIKEISWKTRGGDRTNDRDSVIEYIGKNYGIKDLDPKQPVVVYQIEKGVDQHHIPELLSLGHTFHDLKKRIPEWQRTQVWATIHPDCKNQLQKTSELMRIITSVLREKIPNIYPKFIEFSSFPLESTNKVILPKEFSLQFSNKKINVKPPYNTTFYSKYTGKNVIFLEQIQNLSVLVDAPKDNPQVSEFLNQLQNEFKLRTENELLLTIEKIDFENKNFLNYDLVLTIMNENDKYHDTFYKKCKQIIQNENSVIHQHLMLSSADQDSVMQIIMELSLKFGQNPWLVDSESLFDYLVGVHTYTNPKSREELIFMNVLDGKGKLLNQFDPVSQDKFSELLANIQNKVDGKILFISSRDKFGLSQIIKNNFKSAEIIEIIDNSHVRIFETWKPAPVRRFGSAKKETKSELESQESAPQGIIFTSDDVYYLLTGRTIELASSKRGCPTPLRMNVIQKLDTHKNEIVIEYLLKLCMMSRTSGHMTRMPSPIYYLQSQANYYAKFGMPQNEEFKQKIFHI